MLSAYRSHIYYATGRPIGPLDDNVLTVFGQQKPAACDVLLYFHDW